MLKYRIRSIALGIEIPEQMHVPDGIFVPDADPTSGPISLPMAGRFFQARKDDCVCKRSDGSFFVISEAAIDTLYEATEC